MDKIGGEGKNGQGAGFYTRENCGSPDEPNIWGNSGIWDTIGFYLEPENGTWGGLLGFMLSREGVEQAFDKEFPSKFNIHLTRIGFSNDGLGDFDERHFYHRPGGAEANG